MPTESRGNARMYVSWLTTVRIVTAALALGVASPAAQGDVTPPAVAAQSPPPGATGISPLILVRVTFDEPIQPATLAMELRNAASEVLPASVLYDASSRWATLDPTIDLAGNQTFTVTVSGAQDLAGNRMLPVTWSFTTVTAGFQDVVLPQTGLVDPTVMQFSPDGRLFVAEKGGRVYVFDNLADPSGTLVIDLRTNVHNFWDRGMLGMALHPNFPGTPYIYVLYSHDAIPGGTAPRWGIAGQDSDGCPDPPGPTDNGCVITGRLSRLNVGDASAWPLTAANEHVLVTDWFQQFPSHSVGSLVFGADGALYASAGEGANYNYADFGQQGATPPSGDPDNEGGALRSQDIRTAGDPVTLDGSIIRLDPETGAALPDNPRSSDPDPNGKRLVAHGFRNPFRFTIRPGTNELWVADVGWNTWEEINQVVDGGDSTVENFGWPCFEGPNVQSGWAGLNLPICETLYGQSGAITPPYFTYDHYTRLVGGEVCPIGSSAISGLAFYPEAGAGYPASYQGALFFADYSRSCIWAMRRGPDGKPNPEDIVTIRSGAGGPVHLVTGPGGDVFYVGMNDDRLHRIRYVGGNMPPTANIGANAIAGPVPLEVTFTAAASSDPEGQSLTFEWDLDGDGDFDDSAAVAPAFTYTAPGAVTVRLRVSDPIGLSDVATRVIWPGNNAPIASIATPSAGLTWKVGDKIAFSGGATDADEGALPASSLQWALIMHHCPSNCHTHDVQNFPGIASGAFSPPDHEYPSHLELRLTATDSGGLQSSASVFLHPQTVALTFQSSPSGLQLAVNGASGVAPFTRTVIVGSNNSVSAPTPQTVGPDRYDFTSWSDGGAQLHNVIAPAVPTTYTAAYVQPFAAPGLVAAWPFDDGTGITATDVTRNGHTGALSNTTWSTPGKFGGALTFNGTTSLVRVPDAAALDFTTGLTIEAWVAPATLSGWRTVLMKQAGPDLAYALYAHDNVPRPASYVTVASQRTASGTAAIPLNVWTHLATTYDGAALRVFVNGALVGTTAATGAIVVTSGVLTIGGNDVWNEFFSGRIDEVRLYNRPLSAAEIQTDMTVPLGGPPPPDTTAPDVTITGPAGNSVVRGTVMVAADAADNSGTVASVQFFVDGAPLGAADATAPFAAPWDTATMSGAHTLTAVASDGAGNAWTSTPVTVTVDNLPPTVSITAPAAGEVSGTVTIAVTAEDATGVASVQFRVDGANIGSPDTTAPYSIAWNTGTAANGSHALTAIALDMAGNSATSNAVNVTIDRPFSPPPGLVAAWGFDEGSGATTNDASGGGHTGTLSNATWSPSGKFGGALSFNGSTSIVRVADAAAFDFTGGMTIEAWVSPSVLSGWRTVALKQAGADLAYALYAHDNVPRPASYVTTGAQHAASGTAAIPLDAWTHLATTYDGATLRMFVNGALVGTKDAAGAIVVSTGALTIGGNDIWNEFFSGRIDEVRLYNRALSATEIQTDMTLPLGGPPPPDTTAPEIAIVSPAANALVRGAVEVAAQATDDSGVVASVQFFADGVPLGAPDTNAPFTASWDTAGLSGVHGVTAAATDRAGNSTSSAPVSVTIDNVPPTVTITSPAGAVSGPVSIAATAQDPNGIASVQFRVDGANIGSPDTTAPYAITWDSASAGNGDHVLTAVALDGAGNSATSAPVSVVVSGAWTPPAGLIAAYTFSEGSGTTTGDGSGNGRSGSLNAGVAWTSSGRFGRALTFNGSSGLVSVADAAPLDFTTSLTIEAWVRPTALGGWKTVALKGAGSNALAYGLYASGDTSSPAAYLQIGGDDRFAVGTSTLPLNTWTHLAMTYDGAMIRLYVNGALVGSRAIGGAIRTSAEPLTLGGNSVWGEWFTGQIDEVRLYNRALTLTEIQAGMNQTIGGF